MGAPGANSAREILRDFRKTNTTPEDFGGTGPISCDHWRRS